MLRLGASSSSRARATGFLASARPQWIKQRGFAVCKAELDKPLRADVKTLGAILGNTIQKHGGDSLFKNVEDMRLLARGWRDGKEENLGLLAEKVKTLSAEESLGVSKAFTHFFSLANSAESHHRLRRLRAMVNEGDAFPQRGDTTLGTISKLQAMAGEAPSSEAMLDAIARQKVEIVLTAHPTEVNRRTLLVKHKKIGNILQQLDAGAGYLTNVEVAELHSQLNSTVESIWNSDEVRRVKPSPKDEARAGMAVIEQVLWNAVPSWLRKVDKTLTDKLGKPLPADVAPVVFASWMGGDRDGNPNVTPEITCRVSFEARWQAASLLKRDVSVLRMELSTTKCSPELRARVGAVREPYRAVLVELESKLDETIAKCAAMLAGDMPFDVKALPLNGREEVLDQLKLLYDSLTSTGQLGMANGGLLDLIRRVRCFGLSLIPLDVRQESTRHTEALDAITRHLGVGSYSQWDEKTRQTWLIKELNSKRPLLSKSFGDLKEGDLDFDSIVVDTLGTFDAIAKLGEESLGAYVISMATSPSDVLGVKLLQKEAKLDWDMRVVPLFETLSDLEGSSATMDELWSMPWYRGHIDGKQEVMIGYSDSAKDAGRLAAAWAQYETQEQLAKTARKHGVQLTFFHGKGGTVSRGGNPALYEAILAQPAGTVEGRFRVTEQGEMITQNFGTRGIAERTLDIYTAGVLHDTFVEPPIPREEWRAAMAKLSDVSCADYRDVVRQNPNFVPYFRSATPELELASLNIGSRPAKRRPTGGVETLRAIPWVFAWTQTRMTLPAWLGVGEGLSSVHADSPEVLADMYTNWPFFKTNIDLFEMVLAKSDTSISKHYDDMLVADGDAKELGETLRGKLDKTREAVLGVSKKPELISDNALLKWQLMLRNPYVDPLNVLQVRVLQRLRNEEYANDTEKQQLQDALVITINGIAAGMRNSG